MNSQAGLSPMSERLIQQVAVGDPPRPRQLQAGLPRDLETIVLKAIAREPELRYEMAASLAEDLQWFLEDRPIRARQVSGPERGAAGAVATRELRLYRPAFSPDGSQVVAVGDDVLLQIWDAATGEMLRCIRTGSVGSGLWRSAPTGINSQRPVAARAE